MFTKRIIPCLDVNNGRVVKGVNFVDLKDAGDPVEIAKAYDAAGADELVFLDITASSDGRGTVIDMVREVAKCVFIPFTVGGGIRTVEDFKALLREGADKISINSSAIANPQLIRDAADKFGSQCVVVAIDARKREDRSGWNIYKNGGRVDVGIDAIEWAKKVESLGDLIGIRIICHSIGMFIICLLYLHCKGILLDRIAVFILVIAIVCLYNIRLSTSIQHVFQTNDVIVCRTYGLYYSMFCFDRLFLHHLPGQILKRLR